MRIGYGEFDESEMTYTLVNGQATFRGERITWHPRGRMNQSSHLHTPKYARLHRVSYDLILRKNVQLGYQGKFVPMIPKGCTRICGEAKSLKIWISGGTLILNLGPQMYWDIKLDSYGGAESNITAIWQDTIE